MKLSLSERNSPAWLTVKDYLELRLSLLRRKNDNKIDGGSTEWLRGQIAEVKHLLTLDKEGDMQGD